MRAVWILVLCLVPIGCKTDTADMTGRTVSSGTTVASTADASKANDTESESPKPASTPIAAPAQPPVPLPDPEWIQQFSGVYSGVLPCGDCQGIETVIELRPNGTARRTQHMQGSSLQDDSSVETYWTARHSTGKQATGSHNPVGKSNRQIQLTVNYETLIFDQPKAGVIRQLDLQGKVMGGKFAKSYVLSLTPKA